MKRKPAITIRMSAAHWDVTIHEPTLDLGVHLPMGPEGVRGMVRFRTLPAGGGGIVASQWARSLAKSLSGWLPKIRYSS